MTQKMFGLHKNDNGDVLGAFEFTDAYDLASRVRNLDIRDGDWLDFKETAQRPTVEAPKEVRPTFLAEPLEAPGNPSPTEKLLDDEQPF